HADDGIRAFHVTGVQTCALPIYEDAQERLGNIEELLTGAQNYSLSNPEADFVEFLETVSLVSDADQRDDASNQVTVMTLHAAKEIGRASCRESQNVAVIA